MPAASNPAPHPFQVAAKVRHVAEHHYDDSRPGKPLALLVPGAIVALAALAGVIFIVYETWYLREFSEQRGYAFTTILAPLYAAGVFVFSYGYELYSFTRALRLTAIIVVVTVLAVILVAALFAVVSASKDAKSSSSSSSKSSSSNNSNNTPTTGGRVVTTALYDLETIRTPAASPGPRAHPYAPVQQASAQAQPLVMHCQYCGSDVTIQPTAERAELKCPKCQASLTS